MIQGFFFLLNFFFSQILANPSPIATLSEQLVERIHLSGLGMMTKWSPQQFILNHPVFFFTSIPTSPTCPIAHTET